MEKTKFSITAWYLNPERISKLLGSKTLIEMNEMLQKYGGHASVFSEADTARTVIQETLEEWLKKNEIDTLAKLVANGNIKNGDRFILQHDFYCKGPSKGINATSMIRAKLRFSPDIDIEIPYSEKNLCCQTAKERLSGHSRLFVFGYIEKYAGDKIVARPYIIGDIHYDFQSKVITGIYSARLGETHISLIDAFAKYKEIYEKLPVPNLNILKSIPEKRIKEYFAQIIGEKNIPKDWGGEKSDLYTANLKVEGQYMAAAFIFKGPSKYKEMEIADLGKNGDQIDRLYFEPAQMLILQHCHKVSSSVRNMMKAYANQINNPRLYCVIDGYDTIRILKAYKKI
ncbi:MAG: hypothetical protein PHP03_00405 [Candidatus Pacebacteria bacterium]|nr:hypothetical protein [Candidatus Paceibacterota bacterium]